MLIKKKRCILILLYIKILAIKLIQFPTIKSIKYIHEDLNPHLLTLTQLAEESTALTVCPSVIYTMIFSTLYHEFVCHVEHYSVELDT